MEPFGWTQKDKPHPTSLPWPGPLLRINPQQHKNQSRKRFLFKVLGFVALGSFSPPPWSLSLHLSPACLNSSGRSMSPARGDGRCSHSWGPASSSLPALPFPGPHQGHGLLCLVIVPLAPGLFAPTFLLRLTTHDKPNRMKPNPDFSQEMFFWGTNKLPIPFLRMIGCYKLLLSGFT